MPKSIEMQDILKINALDYARYTITDRAIPSLEDGLKSIHRRIVWSMFLDKLTHDKARTKSINAVGSVLRFSPHGDTSVYDACVRLANDSVMYPLIDGKGAFSSITTRDVTAGAPRYTGMRLSEISSELVKDINRDAVTMVNNFDDTRLEPEVMPSNLPLILINPSVGIAMGIATRIASFNIDDVIENTINIIKGKKTFAMYPDFPTFGNVVEDKKIANQVKKTGRGGFKLRAEYHFEGNSITITEIPYTTTREAIIESVTKLVGENKIQGISDINDNTGKDGLDITIDLKRGADKEQVVAQLFARTPLESTFNCNFFVLSDNKPVILGTDGILEKWVAFRKETIKRINEYEIDDKLKKKHLLEGLEKIVLDIDRAIDIIKNTPKNNQVVERLSEGFNIDKTQAEYVADIRLRQLNKETLLERINEIAEINKDIESMEEIISDDKVLSELIVSELNEIKKKYSKERKTSIVAENDIPVANIQDEVIDDYNVKVFITKEGYVKKIPLTSMRGDFNNRVKDTDSIIAEFDATNTDEIIFFTSGRNAHKRKLYEIEDARPSVLGEFAPTMLNLDKDEEVLYTHVTSDFTGTLLFGFDDGRVARVNLEAYETVQNRSVLRNAYADKNIVFVDFLEEGEEKDIIAISHSVKGVILDSSVISPKATRTSAGVWFMRVKDEKVVEYAVLDEGHEFEYYKQANAGVGKYLKKKDFLKLKELFKTEQE